MRFYIILICFISYINTTAQIAPILDHTWTIEKIVKEDGQVLMADLNPFGEYDTFKLIFASTSEGTDFYVLEEVFFGHCQMRFSFNDSNSELFYHPEACMLSNDDSSVIALYFNEEFIFENTPQITIDNPFFPFAFGPLSYSFTTEEDMIYLDITNPIGEVARFYAANLSQQNFLKQQIKIYPNPATSIISVDSPNISITQLKIFDLKGRILLQKNELETKTINVSILQKGVYLLEVKTALGVLRKKFIKE